MVDKVTEMLTKNFGELETLFKVEGPFTEIKDGFGYVGIILSDKTTGKLQCHICGEFFELLSSHVRNRHAIQAKDYRIKFQLPLSFPLCSRALSKKISNNSQKNGWEKHLPKYVGKKYKGKYSNNTKYGRNNASFHNKHGLCDLQMESCYLLVTDLIGHHPTEKELEEHDAKLIWAIKNRFGNINNFKYKHDFEKYRIDNKNKVMKLKDINYYQDYVKILSKEEREYLINKYGSIRRAILFLGKEEMSIESEG